MYLGVRAALAKSIERIHQANLVNFAVLPLILAEAADYERTGAGDRLRIAALTEAIASAETVTVTNLTGGFDFTCRIDLTARQRDVLLAGGLLNYTRRENK
jgi:aconitate hydratase